MSNALTGLSGYDFSGIVSSMMQAYKLPETQMQTQESTLQTQQNAWHDVNTRLSALDATLTTLESSDTWTATTASSSDTNIVTATGGSGALPGTYSVNVNNIATAEVVVSQEVSDPPSGTYTYTSSSDSSSWDFGINGKKVVIRSSTSGSNPSLTDIANSINRAQAGVTASVIQVSSDKYRLSITSNKTGKDNAITFDDSLTNSLQNVLGINASSTTVLSQTDLDNGLGGITQAALDAQFKVNGVSISSASNTVTTAIQGITLNLTGASSSTTATVAVTADPSVAEKAVQAFVDQYNSVQSFIATELNYDTTTKTAGDLFGDAQLQDIQSRLRGMLGGIINKSSSPYTLLSDVGISTSADNFGESAALSFDKGTFEKAFADNPQSVANLFSASYNGVTPENDTVHNIYEGLGNTLHAYLNPIIMYGGTLSEIDDSYNRQIKDVQDQIDDFEQRATDYETMLNAKFANLETVLAGLNSQGTWLSSQIAAMSGSSSSSSSSKSSSS
ncbi:flagellar filament capping protein FliD [Desulfosporosinus sp. FKA]|uniref:flagellar filament capping protein FliD n=1 Tax=Desulfosporosinus sp. FKA TaxID=1969834 RepID=UPI000B49B71F|nr:flagellar filament capping protein FliD [Desulfosporosinus sp. FKA]